jgi:hypothetical protein
MVLVRAATSSVVEDRELSGFLDNTKCAREVSCDN